ncbi:hypothetical protein [Bradyrhizobium sp. B117]|uniref:hypothetical protein n=1 Tax=Bradyrhizobium sp. B117 TaxID=3140246 RepID=UPI003183A9B5
MPDRKRFGLDGPSDLLLKLNWEIMQLGQPMDQEAIASYRAFNCAVTAWSLCDWTWNSASNGLRKRFRKESPKPSASNSEPLAALLRDQSRELAICQQLANGSKHFVLRDHIDEEISTYRSAAVHLYVSKDGQSHVVPGHGAFVLDGDHHYSDIGLFSRARDYWVEFFKRYAIG